MGIYLRAVLNYVFMAAAFRSYDVYTASLKRMKVRNSKEDGIIWKTPLVTNNSDTHGYVFCYHLTLRNWSTSHFTWSEQMDVVLLSIIYHK